MVDKERLSHKVQELVDREWDTVAIKAWFDKLSEEGIPRKTLLREEIVANKATVLERIQRKGEEAEFLSHS